MEHSAEFKLILALQENFNNAADNGDIEKMQEIFDEIIGITAKLQGFKEGVLEQEKQAA